MASVYGTTIRAISRFRKLLGPKASAVKVNSCVWVLILNACIEDRCLHVSRKFAFVNILEFLADPGEARVCSTNTSVTLAILDCAYWWSCIGKGMRLQPVQLACSLKVHTLVAEDINHTKYVMSVPHQATPFLDTKIVKYRSPKGSRFPALVQPRAWVTSEINIKASLRKMLERDLKIIWISVLGNIFQFILKARAW